MSAQQAQAYHHAQIKVNYVDEAIGTARAAQQAGLPMAIEQADEMTARYPTHDKRDCAIPRTLSGFWSEAGLGWRGFGACARTPHNGATPT